MSGRALPSSSSLGVVADPVPAGRAERVGHRAHQPGRAAVLDDPAELVDHQVAVRGRIQGSVGAPLGADRVEDAGELAGAEHAGVGAAGGDQGVAGGLAGAQCLPQPLQVGAGDPGPVLDDLAQPAQFDCSEVDRAAGGGPAPGGVDGQAEQRDLPHVTGERVRPAVAGPGLLQVPTQVAKQPPGARVVDRAAGLADHLRVGRA